MLRDCDEDAGRERHVEDPVGLTPTLFERLEVLPQIDEVVVLVILARDIRAEVAEVIELFLNLLCGCLDIGSNSFEELFVVHLRPGIANDFDIVRKEVVSVLTDVSYAGAAAVSRC